MAWNPAGVRQVAADGEELRGQRLVPLRSTGSVQMAIDLELRYRGLRAPHKIKMGVSGCARECAEARGKDVGVIATETGWNLYVGGNGGDDTETRPAAGRRPRRRDADPLRRPLPDVLHPHGRPAAAHRTVGGGARGWHRPSARRGLRRLPRAGGGVRGRGRAPRRRIRVRVEGRAGRSRQAVAVRLVRQCPRRRRSHSRIHRTLGPQGARLGMPAVRPDRRLS